MKTDVKSVAVWVTFYCLVSGSLSAEFRNAVVECIVYHELINECVQGKYSSSTSPNTSISWRGQEWVEVFLPQRGVSLNNVAKDGSRYFFYFSSTCQWRYYQEYRRRYTRGWCNLGGQTGWSVKLINDFYKWQIEECVRAHLLFLKRLYSVVFEQMDTVQIW